MAFEQPGFQIAALVSNAAMTTQYLAVKKNTTALQVQVCDTDGEVILGILQNAPPAANASAEVMAMGVSKIVCAEALAVGDFWGTDSAGKAKKVDPTVTGADVGDYVGGQVLTATTAADEVATVTIGLSTFVVEAQ